MAVDKNGQSKFVLEVKNISKRFNKQKLFTDLSFSLKNNDKLAIIGANGSGKSTLLKIIAGVIAPTRGDIILKINEYNIQSNQVHQYINICAPYLDLIDEFTLREHLNFHAKFKTPLKNLSLKEIIEEAGLHKSYDKLISEFSSGMKQRLKLILSLCFEGDVVLLDEPSAHLDQNGKNWYKQLIERYTTNRITIFFSNESEEYMPFTNNLINIEP